MELEVHSVKQYHNRSTIIEMTTEEAAIHIKQQEIKNKFITDQQKHT
jgi:hypothetical protein